MKLIVLNGPSGIGKSTVALALQKELPLSLLLDLDALRRLIEGYRERRMESAVLSYKHALALTDAHLEAGYSVIVEKVMLKADWFLDGLRALSEKYGAQYHEIFLTASKQAVITRAHERGFKPGSLLTPVRVEEIWEESQELMARREGMQIIDTTEMNIKETVEQVTALVQ